MKRLGSAAVSSDSCCVLSGDVAGQTVMSVFYLQLASTPTGDLSELDRIQDLFPSDSLGLHGRDPTSQVSPSST